MKKCIVKVSVSVIAGMFFLLMFATIGSAQDADWYDVATGMPPVAMGANIYTTGNVAIGIAPPIVVNTLDVAGNVGVGTAYAGNPGAPWIVPPNGMIIEGTNGRQGGGGVGIGNPIPSQPGPFAFPACQLHVDLEDPGGGQPLVQNTIYEVGRIGVTNAMSQPAGLTDYAISFGVYDDVGYPVIQAFDQVYGDPN